MISRSSKEKKNTPLAEKNTIELTFSVAGNYVRNESDLVLIEL